MDNLIIFEGKTEFSAKENVVSLDKATTSNSIFTYDKTKLCNLYDHLVVYKLPAYPYIRNSL